MLQTTNTKEGISSNFCHHLFVVVSNYKSLKFSNFLFTSTFFLDSFDLLLALQHLGFIFFSQVQHSFNKSRNESHLVFAKPHTICCNNKILFIIFWEVNFSINDLFNSNIVFTDNTFRWDVKCHHHRRIQRSEVKRNNLLCSLWNRFKDKSTTELFRLEVLFLFDGIDNVLIKQIVLNDVFPIAHWREDIFKVNFWEIGKRQSNLHQF